MRKLRYLLGGRLLPCALLLSLIFAAGIALAVWIPRALAPIAALERLFSFGAALFIAASFLSAESKARRLLLLLIPWIGVLLCLTIRPPVEFADIPVTRPFDDATANAVSAIAFRGCKLFGCHASDARFFRTGREMYERLLTDLNNAEHEILLDYYILARGTFFDSVLTVLEQKAKSGVDVSLIYDDFGCALNLPRKFAGEMRRRGIKTTVFHPIRAFPFGALNRRDHRKIAVIDRRIAYTGGVNLADEYIGEKIRFGHWKDTAIRLTGEPAERFAALFRGRAAEFTQAEGSPCVVFGDGAQRGSRVGEEIYFRLISATSRKLYLCTPYLAPGEKLSAALKAAAAAGADVRILIPHIPDKKSVFALSRSYARQLKRSGIKVREYAAGFLHAKSLVADGKYAVIGSYNLDERSMRLQAECGVFLVDDTLCREMERDFLSCWETGVSIPKASFKEKIIAFFMRLFSPLA